MEGIGRAGALQYRFEANAAGEFQAYRNRPRRTGGNQAPGIRTPGFRVQSDGAAAIVTIDDHRNGVTDGISLRV